MSFFAESRAQAVPRTLLVVLRLYLAVLFLEAAIGKLTADPTWTPNLIGFLERIGLERSHLFYRGFLQETVLPNAGLFAALVTYGELLTGLALATGTATRLAAAATMFMTANYMFAKGAWFWQPSSNDAAFFFIALILLLGAAGRAFGVDYYLAKRLPRVPLW